MRRLFFLSLIALVLGVAVVALVEREPGYVLVSYGQYTVESSLWIALALIALAVFSIYVLLRLLHMLLVSPVALSRWLSGRKAGRASMMTSRGLVSFTEGNWSKARSQLLRGVENHEAPLFNYLGAARASARLDEPKKVSEYLVAAENTEGEAGGAVALTRAQLQLEAGAYAQTLETLSQGGGKSPAGLDLQCRALLGLEDWQGLAVLLPELKKQQVMAEAKLQDLERSVWVRLLESCADQGPTAAGTTIGQQWQQVPGDFKRDPMVVRTYCHALMLAQDHQEAEKILLKAQRQHWDSQLAGLYAYIETDDPARQLSTAEGWLDQHSDDAELLLALGRLAARNELWGKARDYFEKSYKLTPGAEACAELGRLLAAQGEHGPADIYYRQGLVLADVKLPELPMPETSAPGPSAQTS